MVENKELYSFLVKNEGFYMNQYESEIYKEEKWICIKRLKEGLYTFIITNENEEDINIKEAKDFLNKLNEPYILNVLVLTKGRYIEGIDKNVSRVIYNPYSNSILRVDEGSVNIANIIKYLNSISKENDKKSKFSFLKEYPVTSLIILINVLVFLITAIFSRSILDIDPRVLLMFGAKEGYLINNGEVYRLLTAAFLHGGLIHLAVNMYSLYAVGCIVEKIYGYKKYIGIYLFSAITSSYLSYKLDPLTISVGASGAIFGVLGAVLVFAIKEKDRLNKGFMGNIVSVIILNLFIGMTNSNIDNFGHIGGFIGGVIISLLLYKKDKRSKSI